VPNWRLTAIPSFESGVIFRAHHCANFLAAGESAARNLTKANYPLNVAQCYLSQVLLSVGV
jgi:hypothetical protein